jgi:transposase
LIPVPSAVRVWLAVGHTDMRRGMNGLALQVQEALQRERVVIPGPTACPCCNGKLAKLGEDVTETLEVIPRQSRTSIGRLWTYVRDDRPFGGPAPPAALFHYSGDRGGAYPARHLAGL